jgi:RNA polymerase sigma-70 factor, ECF subfamily
MPMPGPARPVTDGHPPDGELVRRIRIGDASAFNALVGRHLRPAVRLATRLLGDDDAAEDVVQDSFLAVLEAIDRFDDSRRFAPWFYQIVANRCSNVRRSASRRPAEPIPAGLAADGPGPEQHVERGALRDRLRAGLATLPDRQREILMLYDVEGFSGPEIATMLEISPGTVRWHLHQARAAMREILGEEEEQ